MNEQSILKQKHSTVKIFLTVLFTTTLIISNIISVRTFNLFGFTMTSAILVFPITYILSDLFSEVYGYKWSRFTCYLAFALSILFTLLFMVVDALPAQPFTQNVAESFTQILGGVSASTFASFIAFVVGDFVNDKVFHKMKKKHPGILNQKGFGIRAIISSVAGDLCDSLIYIPLAFVVFNSIMNIWDALIMILLQVSIKIVYELLILPVNIIVVKKVAKYESTL